MTEGYTYRIIAPGSNSVYVGQSENPARRFLQHKQMLGYNPHLDRWLRKHPDATIHTWPTLDMNAEEIADAQLCKDMGFTLLNIAPCGGSSPMRGRKHAATSCVKMSISRTGKTPSAETRARMSAARLGTKPSDAARANMSVAQRGKKHGPMTAATREKISAALLGKSHRDKGTPWSATRRIAQNRGRE